MVCAAGNQNDQTHSYVADLVVTWKYRQIPTKTDVNLHREFLRQWTISESDCFLASEELGFVRANKVNLKCSWKI